jgi:hypothetical protein
MLLFHGMPFPVSGGSGARAEPRSNVSSFRNDPLVSVRRFPTSRFRAIGTAGCLPLAARKEAEHS